MCGAVNKLLSVNVSNMQYMNWNDVFMSDYIVYDLETSGLKPEAGDRIIEFGILGVDDDNPSEPLSWLINPSYPGNFHIPTEVTVMTGINDTEISYGADGSELIPSMMDRFRFKDLVGHNIVKFDDLFLEDECKRLCILSPDKSSLYDTAAMFKAVQLSKPDQTWTQEPHILEEIVNYDTFYDYAMYILSKPIKGLYYNLPHCCEVLGIDTTDIKFHRAGGDTLATYRVREALKDLILVG